MPKKGSADLVMVVADMVRQKPALSAAFVAEFSGAASKDRTRPLSIATMWIEQRLAESHQTIDQLVLAEHQDQGRGPGVDRQLQRNT